MFAKTSRWIAYPLGWLLLMLVPLVVDAWRESAGPTSDTNRFSIDSFDATYQARRAGNGLALDVTEKIRANFPTRYVNHGIERRLDAFYGNTDIQLSGFTVTDPRGKRISFSKRTESDGDIVLRIGSSSTYVYGPIDYVIRYTIGSAMVQAADRQEIYLDVNGTGWQQPFRTVRATVLVPNDLAGDLLGQQACYRGPAGSTTPCAIYQTGSTTIAQADSLNPRESMTIAIGFKPGTVAEAVPAPRGGLGWLGIAAMPAFAALVLLVALVVRRQRLRNLLLRDDAEIRYTTPDVQPILAADFLGLAERGAAAQLTQLVLDGHATLSSEQPAIGSAPQPRDRLSHRDRADVRGDLRVQLVDRENIDRSVEGISSALFGRGRSIALGNVRRVDVQEASRERWNLLLGSGLRAPSWLGTTLFWIGYLGLIGFGWVQIAMGLRGLVWPFLGLGVLAVLLMVAAVHYYPTLGRLTGEGRALRDHLAGLHRFVTMAEADRIAWMQNAIDAPRRADGTAGSLVDLYEPLLPYAIIFGVENTWRQALGDLYDLRPERADHPVDVSALRLALSWAESFSYTRDYHRQDAVSQGFWDSRPAWGDGWVSHAGSAFAEGFGNWATSRDDDSGGSWGSGGSSSWSSSSSGSSGGGSSGGGMGGGGGGGW